MISLGAVLLGDVHPFRGALYILIQLTGTTSGCLMSTAFTASGDPVHPAAEAGLRYGRASAFFAEAVYACVVTFVTLISIQKHKACRAAASARLRTPTATEGEATIDAQVLIPNSVKCALYGTDTIPSPAVSSFGFAIGCVTVATVKALVRGAPGLSSVRPSSDSELL